MNVRRIVAAAIAASALFVPVTAHAANLVYVAGPGGIFLNYTLPVMVMTEGDTITFVNTDAFQHDFVATAHGPDTQPWCDGPAGTCPLFWTPLLGLAAQSPVLGLENVTSGNSYKFICTIHSNMKGTLVVL